MQRQDARSNGALSSGSKIRSVIGSISRARSEWKTIALLLLFAGLEVGSWYFAGRGFHFVKDHGPVAEAFFNHFK